MWVCGLDWAGPGQGHVAGPCEIRGCFVLLYTERVISVRPESHNEHWNISQMQLCGVNRCPILHVN